MEQRMIESTVADAIEAVNELDGKVYPLNAPENGELPYVVYVSSGSTEDDKLNGWIGSYDTDMEINVLHRSYKALKLLSKAVVQSLKRISAGAVYIEENQPELYEPEIEAYRKIINIKIQH